MHSGIACIQLYNIVNVRYQAGYANVSTDRRRCMSWYTYRIYIAIYYISLSYYVCVGVHRYKHIHKYTIPLLRIRGIDRESHALLTKAVGGNIGMNIYRGLQHTSYLCL